MKKILISLLIFALLASVVVLLINYYKKDMPVVVYKGNFERKALLIKLNKTNCAKCAMVIKNQKNSVEVAIKDGRTWFFDDLGCMVEWLKDKPFKNGAKIWVHSLDTNRWIDAREAKYTTNEDTVMHYGFGAREYGDNKTISFQEMQERVYKNQTLRDLKHAKGHLVK